MHVKTLVEHVRFYSEGLSYENKDPYNTILTVVWLDDNTISLQGLRGEFDSKKKLQLIQYYKNKGVTKAYYEREGERFTLHVE